MQRMKRPAMGADGRNRTVDETRIVDYLVLCGWSREAHSEDRAPAERAARAALDGWIALGLPFARTADGARRFDPAEVVNFLKWAGAALGDPFWEERFIANTRELVRAFHSPIAPGVSPPPATLGPRRFTVTVQREFALQEAAGAHALLRLPLPLEDDALRDLAIECIAPPGVDVDFAIAPGRLDARFAPPPAPTITLGVRLSFTARPSLTNPQSAPLTPADRKLYTRSAEGLVRISPQVQALAARLVGIEREPWSAVRRFWNFLVDELTCGVIDYEKLDAARPLDHVLESGWFDCQLGSALLVALCRTQNIPARIVSGYLLYPLSPAYHWWAEAWLADRGWIPLDTICADLSTRGRDAPWRDYFVGQLDYRMKTEVLPRLFNRSPGLRLPAAWRILARADREVTEIGPYACATGALIFRDRIVVRHGADASSIAAAGPSLSVNAGPL